MLDYVLDLFSAGRSSVQSMRVSCSVVSLSNNRFLMLALCRPQSQVQEFDSQSAEAAAQGHGDTPITRGQGLVSRYIMLKFIRFGRAYLESCSAFSCNIS